MQPEKTIVMQTESKNETLKRIADGLTLVAAKTGSDLDGERIADLLELWRWQVPPNTAMWR